MDADGGCGCGGESVWFAVIVAVAALFGAIALASALLPLAIVYAVVGMVALIVIARWVFRDS